MTRVAVEVDVNASVERVWRVISDPRNLPHWDKHITGIEDLPPMGLHQGSVYVTVMKFMGVRTHVVSKVLEWEPPRRATIRLTGVVDATVTITITSLDGDRSVLRHEVEYHFRGGPLGEFAARSLAAVGGAQLALRHGILGQKREIERDRR
jgi:uncharacterized protein YndB with AHSA1/START domain